MVGKPKTVSATPRVAYSIDELCEMLGLSRTTITALIESGRIPAVRLGRQWRVSTEAVDRIFRGAR